MPSINEVKDDARVDILTCQLLELLPLLYFLMFKYLIFLLREIFLLVQQQSFEDMRVKNIELTRSAYKK